MSAQDDPYVQAMLALNAQTQAEIAMLASVFAIDAITSGRHTHESIADLFDGVGRDNPKYADSVLKALAKAIRGGSLRPSLTLIEGGKSEE